MLNIGNYVVLYRYEKGHTIEAIPTIYTSNFGVQKL